MQNFRIVGAIIKKIYKNVYNYLKSYKKILSSIIYTSFRYVDMYGVFDRTLGFDDLSFNKRYKSSAPSVLFRHHFACK